jgi:hypothetical protein
MMGARIKQVYKSEGVTLTVSVEASGEAATQPFYDSFGLVANAIEDFMSQYPEPDGSGS